MRNFARIPLCRPPPGKRLSRGAHLGGKHPFRLNKANINTLSNFLDVLEFEEGKEDETEYRRIDDLSKYIEVIKLRDNPINQSKYYGYNFENEENFFHPNGELKNLPEQVRQNEGERVKEYLHVPPFVLAKLCEYAFKEILFFLNKKHLKQLSNILNDGESSKNDKYVAMTLIKNAVISAEQNLPGCQDTGTAIILGKKDEGILTTYEHKYLNLGVYNAYRNNNFRYSQLSPLSMFSEANTKNNLPCQIEIYSSVRGGKALGGATYTTSSAPTTSTTYTTSSAPTTSTTYTTSNAYTASNETTTCTASGGPAPKYELIFIAKGGGSANKTFLFQQTKSILNEDKLYDFLLDKIKEIGTSACPPYHLAVVIGGLSAEMNLKMVKLASCRYLDSLKKQGGGYGKAFRDIKSEQIILEKAQGLGIGAQFGGKYFVHDVRVIRLPRHSASCPIGIGVSCSADRQIKCVINRQGVFMEALEHEPIKYLPEITYKDLKRVGGMAAHTGGMAALPGGDQQEENQSGEGLPGEGGVPINLNQPMGSILKCLSEHPVSTLLLLTGKLIVARDTAHKRIVDDFVLNGIPIPEYFKKFPIYYAGPAKTPDNYASGSFGPTTAGRMDAYAEVLMKNEASLISLAKGNRSSVVRNACRKYHGFYLGSIGGPGAILAKKNIKKVEVIDFAELGMEAVHLIDVVDFPAFIVIDDKGNDFYNQWIPS